MSALEDCLFCLDAEGMIRRILKPQDAYYGTVLAAYSGTKKFHELAEGQYFLPGFIDLHIHAPQWAQAGTAMDIPLHDWLETYTFPLEAKFADLDFARKVYQDLVTTLLANGTTTALYFATVHKEAVICWPKSALTKVNADWSGKWSWTDKEENPSITGMKALKPHWRIQKSFIQLVQELDRTTKQGVYPVVTPRFIPSCTDASAGGSALAKKYGTHIQSHCSESDWEHNYVFNRMHKSDTFALHEMGLLQNKAVMAHAISFG